VKAPEFGRLRSRQALIPIPFDVYDPATGEGSRMRILVDVRITEDRNGASVPDGRYTGVNRGRDREVVYRRVGDVRFAPFFDVCNRTPDMYRNLGVAEQLSSLRSYADYAMPVRFSQVFALDEASLHSVTGRRPLPLIHEAPRRFDDVVGSGQVVIGWDERVEAIREAASRCFLVHKDVGLCVAAVPPVWGVLEVGGHKLVQLHMVSPGRSRVDVFDVRRREAAVAFATGQRGVAPLVRGAVIDLPVDLPPETDARDAFVGLRDGFRRSLGGTLCDLDADGVRLWHDCASGSDELARYGSAREMLELLDRIGRGLAGGDAFERWESTTRALNRRLSFEAGDSPMPEDLPGARP
jgi:hypothetical protein